MTGCALQFICVVGAGWWLEGVLVVTGCVWLFMEGSQDEHAGPCAWVCVAGAPMGSLLPGAVADEPNGWSLQIAEQLDRGDEVRDFKGIYKVGHCCVEWWGWWAGRAGRRASKYAGRRAGRQAGLLGVR